MLSSEAGTGVTIGSSLARLIQDLVGDRDDGASPAEERTRVHRLGEGSF